MTRISAYTAILIGVVCLNPSLATAQAPERLSAPVACTGGKVTNGTCVCPEGFKVIPTDDETSGGTCVKTDAENCLGGELTVSGTCLCNGQVVMSGETYLLEYTNGKCVPKRCPVQTQWRDGRCVASSTGSPNPEPETKPVPSREPREGSEEPEHRRPCGRGMIRTHSGCVVVHHRDPGTYLRNPPVVPVVPVVPPSELRQLYRDHQLPGNPQQD
jgi:hypothetical protein